MGWEAGIEEMGGDPSFRIRDSQNLRKRSASRDLCAQGRFSGMKLYSLSDLLATRGNIHLLGSEGKIRPRG